MKSFDEFESVAIRRWKGKWMDGCPLPPIDKPAGGFVLTFHRGTHPPYKAEYFAIVDEIFSKYPGYAWLYPMAGDAEDIVLVGI